MATWRLHGRQPGAIGARSQPRHATPVSVQHIGPGAVAVRGSVTGLRYTFRSIDPQRVDPRDVPGLIRTGRFRRV